MNKIIIKYILIILIIVVFLYAFSSSYKSGNIDNLFYVVAIGVDSSGTKGVYNISFEFTSISSYSKNSSEENNSFTDIVPATSIASAINTLNVYVGKKINLSHCKVVVISTDVASNGISNLITELMNNAQVRPSTNLIISESNAEKYLKSSVSKLEKSLTKYYDIFPTSAEYTGYTSNITIGEFFNNLQSDNIENVAIIGRLVNSSSENKSSSQGGASNSSDSSNSESSSESSSSETSQEQGEQAGDSSPSQDKLKNSSQTEVASNESDTDSSMSSSVVGERQTENIGLAVFKDDVYVESLSNLECLCYSILKSEVDTFTITIKNPLNNEENLDIFVFQDNPPSIKIDTNGDNPTINLNIKLEGRVSSVPRNLDLADAKTLDSISNASKEYIIKHMTDYLYKTSRTLDSDINGFAKIAKTNFLTTKDWENYKWSQKYKNAKFNIKVDANITSSSILTKS